MKLTVTEILLLSAIIPTPPNQERLQAILTQNLSEINWEIFAARCSHCSIVSLVRHNLARANVLQFLPPSIAASFANESHSSAAKHLVFVSETKRLIQALTNAGIASMPLKGLALMIGEFYPVPGLRPAVDVDLLLAPEQSERAFQIALQNGFLLEPIPPGKSPLRVPHEMRHLPLLRSANTNTLLELHYRAFHDLRTRCDFGWAEMHPRAQQKNNISLPASVDIALHLIQHSIVDLTSAHLILRTLADLHFLLANDEPTREKLLARATELNLRGAVLLALDALATIQSGALEQAKSDVQLLLATALSEGETTIAARLFEYVDLRTQPVHKLKHLLAMTRVNTNENQGSEKKERRSIVGSAWKLLSRFNWRGLNFSALRRVAKLRKITQAK